MKYLEFFGMGISLLLARHHCLYRFGIRGNKTLITYHYTITGVSNIGNKVIEEKFSKENLLRENNRAKEEIEYYLAEGEMLKSEYKSGMFD
jgi:hypothetical protein